jgi:hypothetical protein
VTYADNTKPVYVVGVSTGYTNLTAGTVSVQTSGSLDLNTLPNGILGRSCPLEAPTPIYACSNGSLTDSKYCRDNAATNPGPFIGIANVNCVLSIAVAPPVA